MTLPPPYLSPSRTQQGAIPDAYHLHLIAKISFLQQTELFAIVVFANSGVAEPTICEAGDVDVS